MTGRFGLLCDDCDLAHEDCRCVCGLLARARAEERGRTLDAARAAVNRLASDMANWSSAETAAATSAFPDLSVDQWMWTQRGVYRALAAIDALREERK